jgi:methylglutaconyl-CoA hydratase
MISIEHSTDGRIVTLTLNRPERRNALNLQLVQELEHVVRSLGNDEFVRVILLTGAGSVFSAGADLEALSAMQEATDEENLADSLALSALFDALRTSPKVIIARVNGHAIAGGSGLVAACDMAIAVRGAKFGFTEVRIGFIPALVSVLLQFRLREGDLRDLLLSGRLIGSDEAHRMGLINQVVEAEQLDSVVWDVAESVSRYTSADAVARTKDLLARLSTGQRAPDMTLAAQANAMARKSHDCQAGIKAFLAKEETPWVRSWNKDNEDSA